MEAIRIEWTAISTNETIDKELNVRADTFAEFVA